ncbi:MAG: ice-binding family protein [Chitinophagaceae bacterium]
MKKQILLLAFTISLTTSVTFSQAPNLGTVANFELFTSTGAVTNTGISQVTGNVGTNSGSTTGFGNVNGQMHDNDGVTSQASADLLIAYGQLNTATPTFFPAPLLGNGDTLVAGVYRTNAVTSLNGNLTLNAQGNANAVFIFQIQAAFSVSSAAKIKLINGAQACNVFWKVEGLISVASSAFLRGTFVANNAAIALNTNDTLEGRAVSTSGAITTNGVLAYTPSGCGSPVLAGPACPNLSTTASYAIFSGNGSVTNYTPLTTFVKGDVGTNVGLTTGFNPLNVNGTIHPIPDVSTAACAADLLNVYNYLNLLPHDIELLYPAQFGNSLVLTPHTYLMNAAATFNGILYLNAQGNANAVFVIKINGALSTGTFSKVVLINGTQSKNVFWKVDGAVTVNDYSVFHGTIVCNNGAVNFNTGDSLYGRAFTTNGALSTAALVVNLPDGTPGSCSALPLSWLYFRGAQSQKNVVLEWGTTNEINNGFFTIEKSLDGVRFETIGTVNASNQSFGSTNNYSFTDMQPYSTGYYRILQTDKDGRKNYYYTIQIKLNTSKNLLVQHYVQQDRIVIQISNALPGDGSLVLYTVDGKKIASQKIALTKEASVYQLPKPTYAGMYLVYIESRGQKIYSGKLMVL